MEKLKQIFEHNYVLLTLVILVVIINGIVLFNTLVHPPEVNYDGDSHLNNVNIYAQGRLPDWEDSREFFSPPAPYILPALGLNQLDIDLRTAGKIGQIVNVVLSFGVIFLIIQLCNRLRPSQPILAIISLIMLGILPVYYKSMSMIRGEPYVAFFTLLSAWIAYDAFIGRKFNWKQGSLLGVSFGMLMLSRQWGFFVIVGIVLFFVISSVHQRGTTGPVVKYLMISLSIGAIISGWFYLSLNARYGRITAFNRNPASTGFSLSNHPVSFYTEIRRRQVFIDPVRPGLQVTLLPLLYSDLWGDYWMFFLVYGLDPATNELLYGPKLELALSDPTVAERIQTNRSQMGSYLGRVNLVSLIPTVIMLLGIGTGTIGLYQFIRGRSLSHETAGLSLFTLIILSSIIGFLWFIILYPNPGEGDTIKATYLLHIFPLVSILSGNMLTKIANRNRTITIILMIALIIVGIHNYRAMFTQFWIG